MTHEVTADTRSVKHLDGAPFLVLTTLAIAFAYLAIRGPLGQDWWPLQIAGTLVHEHRWDAVYYPPAGDFVSPRFREVAATVSGNSDLTTLTAYLSTPPVAVLFAPLAGHPRVSLALLRLLMAGGMIGALFLAMQAQPERAHLWAWSAVALAPVMAYSLFVGQTAPCFLMASTMAALPRTRGRDWFGGLALGLTILTKATPLAIAVGLFLIGRRRLAVIAVASATLVSVGALPWTGLRPWADFYAVAQRIPDLIAVDWNSLSVDALVLRITRHLDGGIRLTPTQVERTAILACRLPLLGWALWVGWRRRAGAAVWIAWLVATPILWTYYLLALFPCVPQRTPAGTLVLGALLSASVAMQWAGVPSFLVGIAGSVMWLAAAAVFLRRGVE